MYYSIFDLWKMENDDKAPLITFLRYMHRITNSIDSSFVLQRRFILSRFSESLSI